MGEKAELPEQAHRKLAEDFFDAAVALLQEVRDGEAAGIEAAGELLAQTVAEGGRIFAFGAGHSSLPAQDTVYRAGGLAVMNLLNVPRRGRRGRASRHSGQRPGAGLRAGGGSAGLQPGPRGRRTDHHLPLRPQPAPRGAGSQRAGARSQGHRRHLGRVRGADPVPAHHTGTFLKDHCDLVVDSRIPLGDAELTAEGVDAPFAPASTVVTSAVMQAIVATATGALARSGVEPPMLRSGNVDGGHDWNARVMAEYADRIFYC